MSHAAEPVNVNERYHNACGFRTRADCRCRPGDQDLLLLGCCANPVLALFVHQDKDDPVYDYAINYLLSEHPFKDSAVDALCSHETLNFARRIDVS